MSDQDFGRVERVTLVATTPSVRKVEGSSDSCSLWYILISEFRTTNGCGRQIVDRARTVCAIRVLAVLAVCLFLYVLLLVPPETSFEFSDSSGYYEWNGGSSDDPDIKWECNLIIGGNVWWFDANETITLRVAAEYKTFRYSIVRFNLSEVSLRLLTTSGYIPLKETEFSPPLPLENTTSLSASVVRYYKELVFNVTLTGYEFVSGQIGPKVDGNLQYLVRIATTGFRSELYTSVLSNYIDPGVSGWTPSEFHVTIDNPTLRQTGVLVFWSVATVPGLAYFIGRSVRHRSARIATVWASYANSLYWGGMAGLGFLIVTLTVLTFGPIVSLFLPSGKDWYVALTLLASGVPLTAVVLTLRGSRALEFSLPDQEHKYAEIAEIAGIRYRTQQETADYWSSWGPERVNSETLRLVASVPMFFIYWVESFLLVVTALCFPPGVALRVLLPPLTIICFALFLKSEVASIELSSGYQMWRTVWSLFWSLLYSQVCPPRRYSKK